MLEFPLWKRIYLWAVTLVFALAAVPSLLSLGGVEWPEFLPSPPMVNLGLDLAGGSHLMLEANPELTPNLVKAILQYTAERRPSYDVSAQGAGFLNARGAVQLAMQLAGKPVQAADPIRWSRQLLWGATRVGGGVLTAGANAWSPGVVWGASTTPGGNPIVWGVVADSDLPWGARAAAASVVAPDRDDRP